MLDQPTHYTVGEVMASKRISRATFYKLLATGKLRAVKCGRKTLVEAADLARFDASLPVFKSNRHSVGGDGRQVAERDHAFGEGARA